MKLKKKEEKKIMNEVLEKIQKIGIVPVVVLNDAKDAEPLAKALCNGGLPCAEVTFRTDAAEESIRIMSEKYPEMLVGAGTVLNRAGRPCCSSRSKIYRKPRTES